MVPRGVTFESAGFTTETDGRLPARCVELVQQPPNPCAMADSKYEERVQGCTKSAFPFLSRFLGLLLKAEHRVEARQSSTSRPIRGLQLE
jgi:hypothetical protein